MASALSEKEIREVTGLNLGITSAAVMERDRRWQGEKQGEHTPTVVQVGEAVRLRSRMQAVRLRWILDTLAW